MYVNCINPWREYIVKTLWTHDSAVDLTIDIKVGSSQIYFTKRKQKNDQSFLKGRFASYFNFIFQGYWIFVQYVFLNK